MNYIERYRRNRKLCLECGIKITPEVSKRLICLPCSMKWNSVKLLQILEKLNLKF